ncbi:MAG: acyclic terpene utilization AtuA family protein [Pseudomonadota bacterium]
MAEKVVRIGGASGFWGDAAHATPQLLGVADLDYIVYDYLAEITMSILARARAKNPLHGYALDFVTTVMGQNLEAIAEKKLKIISNAGGVNPTACVEALQALIDERGLDLKVACVVGDDLLAQGSDFLVQGVTEMFSAEPFPDLESIQSINAYLGAFPIAKALTAGADIVVTGRCVDSAVTLGALIHSFGWSADDYNRLAAGSLAGHILECGPQATGGNFTDWHELADEIDQLGYPVVEVASNGEFVCTKPAGTGGLVSRATVAEQMLYEIGDPCSYYLPDVCCDFSSVRIIDLGNNRVKLEGAKGRSPGSALKVSATFVDQYRGGTLMTYYGNDADKKAQAQAKAIFRAAGRTLKKARLSDYSETSIEILGTESQYGAYSEQPSSREVVLKIAAKHPDAKGIGVLLKSAVSLGLASPPGLSGFQSSRAQPSPVVRLFSFQCSKSSIDVFASIDGEMLSCPFAKTKAESAPEPVEPVASENCSKSTVPLVDIAWLRSGDKGDKANIGVIARRAEFLPYIWAALTPELIADRFAHFLVASDTGDSGVERFYLPGSESMNILLHRVLGGGGIASIRNDPQAKGYSQLLLQTPVPVSAKIAADIKINKEAGIR